MDQESKRSAVGGVGPRSKPLISTVERGRWGEQRAVEYLVERGYRVLDRNFRFRRCEVDLVVERAGVVVFVEVKCRTRKWGEGTWGGPGPGRSPVSGAQQQRLLKAADAYLRSRKGPLPDSRFDLVVVNGTAERFTVNHLPSAFLPLPCGWKKVCPPWHRLSLHPP